MGNRIGDRWSAIADSVIGYCAGIVPVGAPSVVLPAMWFDAGVYERMAPPDEAERPVVLPVIVELDSRTMALVWELMPCPLLANAKLSSILSCALLSA